MLAEREGETLCSVPQQTHYIYCIGIIIHLLLLIFCCTIVQEIYITTSSSVKDNVFNNWISLFRFSGTVGRVVCLSTFLFAI